MLNKKYSSYRKTIQSTRSELEKLEKSHKSELRMISTTAFKFRSKFFKMEDTRRQSETEAVSVRMYETHFPGFCYEKDGKYRKKVVNNIQTKIADPVESSEKAKELLFTDNELDIRKVICLHLLETHLQSRKYIYRKDGKLCYFVKAPNYRSRHGSQQTTTQKLNEKSSLNVYDKMLPRYVLDVLVTDNIISNLSLNSTEYDSYSEEGSITRRFQVPIYTNTDIRTITSSVLEALEAVESPKLKEILSICQDTDKLKHLLLQEDVLEFLIELTGNQLISRSTAYEVTMTYPVFDKDSNSAETVAQILEFPSDIHVKNILHLIRRTIARRCDELAFCSVPPRRNNISEGLRQNMSWNLSKSSFASSRSNTKNSNTGEKDESSSTDKNLHLSLMNEATISDKTFSHSIRTLLRLRQKSGLSRTATTENFDREETSMSFISRPNTNKESKMKQFRGFPDHDNKYDLKNLSNSQRIMLGLKVASMKCRPVNMHQFENKQKVDILSLISSIVHPPTLDSRDKEISTEDNCYFKDKKGTKQSISRSRMKQVSGLVNLSRHVLSEFRHNIATTENKRRVKKFLNSEV